MGRRREKINEDRISKGMGRGDKGRREDGRENMGRKWTYLKSLVCDTSTNILLFAGRKLY